MKSRIPFLLLGPALMALPGCAHNVVGAHDARRSGVFYGDLGIPASRTDVRIERLSKLRKLSIIGGNNDVFVEDGASIEHIEFVGASNTVSLPEHLIVRITELGNNNEIIRRPLERKRAVREDPEIYLPDVPDVRAERARREPPPTRRELPIGAAEQQTPYEDLPEYPLEEPAEEPQAPAPQPAERQRYEK
jgi:hypothetical protein